MSPDGAWLVVVQLDGKLHLVDPDTFTISETFAGVGPAPLPQVGDRPRARR